MIVGIDLGTTNSAVAIWRDGEVQLVPNSLGKELTPSAVSLDARGQSWVGAAAIDRQIGQAVGVSFCAHNLGRIRFK